MHELLSGYGGVLDSCMGVAKWLVQVLARALLVDC